VLGVEALQDLPHRRAVGVASAWPPTASRSCVGSLTRDRHHATPQRALELLTDGAISATSNVSRTQSIVFSPSPVM
jgi:hypothetical protein